MIVRQPSDRRTNDSIDKATQKRGRKLFEVVFGAFRWSLLRTHEGSCRRLGNGQACRRAIVLRFRFGHRRHRSAICATPAVSVATETKPWSASALNKACWPSEGIGLSKCHTLSFPFVGRVSGYREPNKGGIAVNTVSVGWSVRVNGLTKERHMTETRYKPSWPCQAPTTTLSV